MWFGMHTSGGMMGAWGILLTVLFSSIVIGIVLSLVVWLTRRKGDSSKESAWSILQRRYARGEISKEEFEEKKHHIQQSGESSH